MSLDWNLSDIKSYNLKGASWLPLIFLIKYNNYEN